jgi:hypothetical protein
MMRLTILALSLAALVSAAPSYVETDALVPETTLLGVEDTISNLKDQFAELKAQASSGMEVTPGVKKTIDRMVTMCENEIEPAIKEAHAADQETLNTLMDAVQEENNEFTEKEALLQKDADNVRDLIADEHSKSAAWEKAADTFTADETDFLKKHAKQTKKCCARDNAAVLDVVYVPAYASCDYKQQDSSGDCSKVARKDVADDVTGSFTNGLADYRKKRGSCKKRTAKLAAADDQCKSSWEACGSAKIAEKAAAKLAASERKRMQGEWDDAVAWYNGNYTALMKAYTDKETEVKKDEADRVEEWGAVQVIKCMLLSYKAGGQFDAATEKACSAKIVKVGIVDIGYPAVVKQIVPVLKPFEDQIDDSAYENTCDARKPAPAFSCVVGEPAALPSCDTHKQAPAPVSTYHNGPWDSEKEGSSWKIPAGAHIGDAASHHAPPPPPPPAPAKPDKCKGMVVPATKGDNGVYFTWASPCSGGCSKAVPQCGWGICSVEEWKGLPRQQMKKDKPCSSKIFDKRWKHCDPSNRLVRVEDGGYNELVFCFHG